MRWRDVKNKKTDSKKKSEPLPLIAPTVLRLKAFIVDVFMIYLPILYITAYMILDGKDDFLQNELAIFIDAFLFGLVLVIFWIKSGQSPGYRAYNIQVIDTRSNKKPLFFRAVFRYICFLISGATFLGLFVFMFRKDKKHLHDILSNTSSIPKP